MLAALQMNNSALLLADPITIQASKQSSPSL